MSGLFISVTFFLSVPGNHNEPDGHLFFTGCCFNPPKAIRRELAVVYVMWIILDTFLFHSSEMPVKEAAFWGFSSPDSCNPSPFIVSCKGHLKSLLAFASIIWEVTVIYLFIYFTVVFFFFWAVRLVRLYWNGKVEKGQLSASRFKFIALNDG